MGTPIGRYPPTGSNDPADFASLPNSSDGTPRSATSDFPAQVDSFPFLEDGVDEKVFAQYIHQLGVGLQTAQEWLKLILNTALHVHSGVVTTYAGDLSITVGSTFVVNSTEVFLRGRKLILGLHYNENPSLDGITLTLTPPEGVDLGDVIEITWLEDSTNLGDAHTHDTYSTVYSTDNITFLTTEVFRAGSTEVYLRGRKLVRGTQYDENGDQKGITLTLSAPEGANPGDNVEIAYTVEV